MTKSLVCCLCLGVACSGTICSAEYFVAKNGNDASDGTSREKAFLTIQKGVDALNPGDTLTILPGEYLESVQKDKLGDADKDTRIRAEIPGTVVLRGDIPVTGFRQVEGRRFTYVADLAVTGKVVVVNELDTLKIFGKMPNVSELEFMPGVFFHDQAAGKIYLSSSDMQEAGVHRYSATIIGTHGLYLANPRRVVIEGLAVTGFNAENELHYSSGTLGGVWGIFIKNGKSCVIRDCRAWLNGWGIGMNSSLKTSGDNVIERCVAWANTSQYSSGDMGGLTVFSARRDTIRDSIAFLNGIYGINIYGTGTDGGEYGEKDVPGNDEANKSRLVNNLAWGNAAGDFKVKTGVEYFHTAEKCVGLGSFFGVRNIYDCLIAGPDYANRYRNGMTTSVDNIISANENDLDPDREFADPANHDYRLQETSRFRKAGPDGKDRGPFQYEKIIYYVKTDGDDKAGGLSVGNAWKTVARAAKGLKSGDTLYILPGVYEGDFELSLKGAAGKPVCIRGRGHGPVIIRGTGAVKESGGLEMQRLIFNGDVKITGGKEIAFDNCQFGGMDAAVAAEKLSGLKLTHCMFTGFKKAGLDIKDCTGVCMSGNIFDNTGCPALRVEGKDGIKYSDYNVYREIGKIAEKHTREIIPEFADENGVRVLKNSRLFTALGPLGKPAGLYRDEVKTGLLGLVEKPKVHSAGATTVNIEWMASLPANCELAWGDTPECVNTDAFDANWFGSYSLAGLKPGRTYYFRIKSLRPLKKDDWLGPLAARQDDAGDKMIALDEEPISFATLKEDRAPTAYYVAPDGKDTNSGLDRQNAWKTIQYAADKAAAGDTVLIAGGFYPEQVRVRAAGESNAPVTFKCLPGEKVFMDGAGKALNSAFIVAGKSHVRFDGFYLRGFNLNGPGEFNLYKCRDIRIERCFSDGRSGYTASTVYAKYVDGLLVKNCVSINKMGGAVDIIRSPNLRLENNVFVRPMIGTFTLNNLAGQKVSMSGNIFTDMLEKKAKQNFVFAELEEPAALQLSNNCFVVRCFAPEKRNIFADVDHALHKHTRLFTVNDFDRDVSPTRSMFADPMFAGDPALTSGPENKKGFAPERVLGKPDLDFNSFFATNPELRKRGIGLQPDVFRDFKFNETVPAEK
ncbi:MAG: hypothetical protein WC299_14920 [Kiritimatiellia bacterium]